MEQQPIFIVMFTTNPIVIFIFITKECRMSQGARKSESHIKILARKREMERGKGITVMNAPDYPASIV